MKTYNMFAKKYKDLENGEDLIKLNTSPVNEKDLENAERFYLMRGEWLDRGYVVINEEIK